MRLMAEPGLGQRMPCPLQNKSLKKMKQIRVNDNFFFFTNVFISFNLS
jgi:hypothetical protein